MCCAPIPRCPSPALAGRRLHPLPWALPIPVRVHGRYSRAEIEAAFVILNKSEALFSPSTRYRERVAGRGGCRGWGWRFEEQFNRLQEGSPSIQKAAASRLG